MPLRIYVDESTANPTGWRPWGYKLSGLSCNGNPGMGCGSGCGCTRPRTNVSGLGRVMRRRLAGLGTATPDVGTLQTQVNNISTQLMQMNQDMMAVQSTIQQLNAQGVNTQAEATQLLSQRNDFENIVAQFTTVYRALFGTTPPGLSSLGIEPVTLAGLAAAVAVILGLIEVWWQHEAALTAASQAKLQLQQNIAAALAAGDSQTAQILAGQSSLSTPTDFSTWLQSNWMYLALGVGGLIVLQKVL